jgi:type IV secretory pathway TrbL component
MFLRSAMIVILIGVLPVIAAGTATEDGMQRYKRAAGWLFAAIIYKPIAAVIYSIGFLLLRGDTEPTGIDAVAKGLYSVTLALVVIVMALVALPALIKFVAPVTQRLGSGVTPASVVGAVATGAAVVTGVIATSGAAAAPLAGKGASLAASRGPATVTARTGGGGGGGGGGGAPGASTAASRATRTVTDVTRAAATTTQTAQRAAPPPDTDRPRPAPGTRKGPR